MLRRDEARERADRLFRDLFPLCRSLTGDGNRETLRRLGEVVPLRLTEVPSGTRVFDWTVPDEWKIRDAWVKDSSGRKIIDFARTNLSVVNYSEPVRGTFGFEELSKRIHTLPALPDAIPYRTSYYKRDWGFCMAHREFAELDRGAKYEVCIDSTLDPKGSLTYADAVHRGQTDAEVLLSTYCCHPSLANDNLSGPILSVLLFDYISKLETFYSYRLVIAPETLGVITYLARNREEMRKVLGGAVITTCAGKGPLGLKASFLGNHAVDRTARQALKASGPGWVEHPFVPDGSDERQYATPGFRIPTVTISKDKYYEYREYHTSLDNLEFVSGAQLAQTLQVYVDWFHRLEMVRTYARKENCCEYQLGRRGLYPNLGGAINQPGASAETVTDRDVEAMSWLMHGCDGETDLLALSERSGVELPVLFRSARRMHKEGLLVEQLPKEMRK